MKEEQFPKRIVPKRCTENWIQRGEEIIIIHPLKVRPYWLSYEAALIWKACDGKHTVDEVLEILSKQFLGEKKVLTKDLMSFLEKLEKIKLIKIARVEEEKK